MPQPPSRAPRRAPLALSAALLAGVEEAVDAHALPRVAAFAEAAAALDAAARQDCEAEAVRPACHDAFDACMGVSHLRMGPLEEDGRALAVAFWPDERDATGRALRALLRSEDPAALEPEVFTEASVAARGLLSLERLLTETPYEEGDRACAPVRAIARDLAATAAARAGWEGGFAEAHRTAGAAGGAFPREEDAARALYTALATGLQFTEEGRLDRSLGTFERPRPLRAEARRSERSSRSVALSLGALRELAAALADPPETRAALDRAIASGEALDDPALAGVVEPQGRVRVEALRGEVRAAREAAEAEIGPALGVRPGSNVLDGD